MLCSISSPGPGLPEDEWVRCWSTIVVVPANVDLYAACREGPARTSIISYNAEYASTQCVDSYLYTRLTPCHFSSSTRLMLGNISIADNFLDLPMQHIYSFFFCDGHNKKERNWIGKTEAAYTTRLARGLLYLCYTTHAPGAGAAYRWC